VSRGAHQPRSVARLAAVQALYQMEVSGVGVEAVVREFRDHRFDRDADGIELAAVDEVFFATLVKGVVEKQAAIDRAVVNRLSQGWRLDRLDATVRAILRVGAFELLHVPETPREVAINEYVEISKSFFAGPEAGFINAALDAIARDERPA
jgi:transcription antitermination protein NusB